MARGQLAKTTRRRLLGLVYLATIISLVGLSVAIYNKAFVNRVTVTLRTDHTGNQLLVDSDVKERGIIVGSVRKVRSEGDGAVVTLALDPSRITMIPNNVSAQILPKTLFGESYVALQIPEQAGPAIKAGDVIDQDRTRTALETQRVLGDLLPLLQAVKPAELNATLTAVATALTGRGQELGTTLATLNDYLKGLNPSVPQLVDDLKKLGDLSVQYNEAAPDLLATLDNLQTSARTLIEKQGAFTTLLTTATDTSKVLASFLSDNEQRLITVVDTSNSIYNLLDEFRPEYGCLFAGMDKLATATVNTIQNDQINLSVTLDTTNQGPYRPGEQPRLVTGLGPHCFGLPNPPKPFQIPGDFRCLNDGAALTTDRCGSARTASDGQEAIGSPPETALVKSLISGEYGTSPKDVPDIASMLAAPALRGTQVTVK